VRFLACLDAERAAVELDHGKERHVLSVSDAAAWRTAIPADTAPLRRTRRGPICRSRFGNPPIT
jgi:hypothetical protein